jgi:hypothetical protein
MSNLRLDRDPKDPVPEGLDEVEQQSVMLKAVRQRGGLRKGEELTAVPSGTPPLPGGWTSVGTVTASSGKPYRIYMKFPGGQGHGPLGSRHNKPKGDTGTMARTQHKPNKTTGTPTDPPPTEKPKPIETPPQKVWLGSVESDKVAEITAELKNVVADPGSTEKDITDAIQKAFAAQRQLVLIGGEDDPRIQEMNEQIAEAIEIISETRNSEFESVLRKEKLSPGSQPEKVIKEHLQKALGSMRQRQLMGFSEDEKEYQRTQELIEKGIATLADRQADNIEDVLRRSKVPGNNVTDKELSDATQELFGLARTLELMGISRPKAAKAMGDLGDLLLAMVKRKTETRDALIQKKSLPNSGVTDADVDRATAELEVLKQQVRKFGVSVL